MIRDLWTRHRWLLIGFCAAVAVAFLFAVRAAIVMHGWPDHADEEIEGWMTPRYVAMSWDVPPEVIAGTLDLARNGSGRRVTLEELARRRGVPVATLAAELEAAIAAYRAGQ